MSGINWNLAVPPNIGETFLNGFNRGQAIAKEKRVTNALSQFATNPDDPQAVNALIAADPRLGLQARQQQQTTMIARRKENDELRKRKLIPLAANGDETAQLELLGLDPEVAMRLDDRTKKQAIDAAKYVADAAFSIVQLPEEQRPAAWDAYIDQGVGLYPNLAQHKGKYSPQALQGLVAQAGQMQEWQTFQQPKYTPVGEGGLSGFQYGKPIAGANGQPQNFGGQSAAPQGAPQVGAVVNGYTFKGGDPKDRNNWTQGGQTGAPSATFRGQFLGLSGETVTSTYRDPAHNRRVGGVSNSYHTRRTADGKPMARDSVPPRGMSMAAYAAELRRRNPDMDVINEGDHVHMEPKG